jgi:CAAX protease family protein
MGTSWFWTIAYAVGWLGLMLAYSPLADRVAARWTHAPPTLGAFRGLQQSRRNLVLGIAVAWLLGGVLEELLLRGVILRSVQELLSTRLDGPLAAGIAICAAALVAGVIHLYQGLRGAIIVTQLSVLFGLLFVLSGFNLWTVMLCHGLYDTIAFIRFAKGSSRYSTLEGGS